MNIARAYELAKTPENEETEDQEKQRLATEAEKADLKATLQAEHQSWLNHPYTVRFLRKLAEMESESLLKARTLTSNSGHMTEVATNKLLESTTYRKIIDYGRNSGSD